MTTIAKIMMIGSSNRTFMELKLFKEIFNYLHKNCSNRTFMELKYGNALDRGSD